MKIDMFIDIAPYNLVHFIVQKIRESCLLHILPAWKNARWCSGTSPCIIWALTSVRDVQTKPSKTDSSPE